MPGGRLTGMAPTLINLPLEVLHGVMVSGEPENVARLCCCRSLYQYIKGNRILFKDLYLKNFDEPSFRPDEEFIWEKELPQLVKYRKILQSKDIELKKSHMDLILSSTEHLLASSSSNSKTSYNIGCLTKLFEDSATVEGLMSGSFLFNLANPKTPPKCPPLSGARSGNRSSTPSSESGSGIINHESQGFAISSGIPFSRGDAEAGQMSAKLHVLYGVPIPRHPSTDDPRYRLRSDPNPGLIHPFARSLVYDLRRYTDATLWGPFMDDYSQDVDWEKLETIMILLHYNLVKHAKEYDHIETLNPKWDVPFAGASPHSFISPPFTIPREPRLSLEARDPYNVTGIWMRVVCFMDYNDLFEFNFRDSIPADQPRQPLQTEEAFRLIIMKLEVHKIEPPGEDDGQALPVVRFKGVSAAVRPSWDPNANSKIRAKGSIRLTPQGEVRWTSWSVFHGEERWRSEGIQIGGPQSARGVLGTWFDKDFDVHGPAGPTCFWKVTDELRDINPTDQIN